MIRLAGPAGVLGAVVLLASACGLVGGSAGGSTAAGDDLAAAPAAPAADPAADRSASSERDALEIEEAPVPVRPEVVIPASWPSEVEEVYGRYWLYWEAFAAAHALPNADPTFEPLRSLSTEDNWASLQQQLQGFAADGLVLVLPENSITEHLIRIPNTTVLDKEEGAEVIIQDCWVDDFVQQTVDGVVVGHTEEAKLMNAVMKVVDGEWRVDGVSRATTDSDGYDQCTQLVTN